MKKLQTIFAELLLKLKPNLKNKTMSTIIKTAIITVIESALKNETGFKKLIEYDLLMIADEVLGTKNILRCTGENKAGEIQTVGRQTEGGDGINFMQKVLKAIPKANQIISIHIYKNPNIQEPELKKLVVISYIERQLDGTGKNATIKF